MGNRNRKAKDLELNHQATEFQQYQQKRNTNRLEAKTEAQGHYILAIEQSKIIFGLGPAGTGKTYIAATMAIDALMDKQTERLIITRPAVEAGEEFGFLPGNLEEKYDPYLAPVRDAIIERVGSGHYTGLLKAGRIVAMPLAFMRGMTFKDSWVILDEAQNVTRSQMKMFLTRMGYGTKVIIDGDPRQCDLHNVEDSGLEDAAWRLEKIKGVNVCNFDRSDIVRHGLVQRIVEAYES